MTIASTITKRIETIQPGILFSYSDFKIPSQNFEATAATLSRLVSKGIIKRFQKGKYFKPEKGIFGEVPLAENQILHPFLKDNGCLIGYITGTSVYNQMYLTTQIPNEYVIATNEIRKPVKKGRVKVRFVKAYAEITQNNIFLLQLLDAIKDIGRIPGSGVNEAIELIKIKIKNLSLREQKIIVELALNYPPATRALTGAILEFLGNKTIEGKLYKSLNPLSKYKIGIRAEKLPNKKQWKIE